MDIPDFLKPSKDCFLTVDKKGNRIKIGDVLSSNSLRDNNEKEYFNAVENYEGNLVIPHHGSFLVKHYVECYCEISS